MESRTRNALMFFASNFGSTSALSSRANSTGVAEVTLDEVVLCLGPTRMLLAIVAEETPGAVYCWGPKEGL
jgi:hypothetical protein